MDDNTMKQSYNLLCAADAKLTSTKNSFFVALLAYIAAKASFATEFESLGGLDNVPPNETKEDFEARRKGFSSFHVEIERSYLQYMNTKKDYDAATSEYEAADLEYRRYMRVANDINRWCAGR
jgi:hypothetical protein